MVPFDVDSFLQQPLTARLATHGPTVRPVWFLWEDGAFWVLTGPWTRLFHRVREDPAVALVVDECDPATGLVRQVIAGGGPRSCRSTSLGGGASSRAVWGRLEPASVSAQDLSYAVAR